MTSARGVGAEAEEVVRAELIKKGQHPERFENYNEDGGGMPDYFIPEGGYVEVKTLDFSMAQVRQFQGLVGVKIAIVPVGTEFGKQSLERKIVGKTVYIDASQFFSV